MQSARSFLPSMKHRNALSSESKDNFQDGLTDTHCADWHKTSKLIT